MIQPIIFGIILLVVSVFCFRAYGRIIRNIRLAKPTDTEKGQSGQRMRNMLLVALGQKKMFKRPLAALLHMCVYVAFLVTQIELIEIVVDGLFSQHRFFAHILPIGLYDFIISTIEILSVLALVATFAFLARRNLLKLPRFQKDEMTGWPKIDGNLILLGEIILVFFIFTMNSADLAHMHSQGLQHNFAISGFIAPIFENANTSETTLIILERIGWWGHIVMVFAFLCYLPISKHLHIIFAFPNTYMARLDQKGEVLNMPEVQKEVESMLDPNAAFAEPDMDAPLPKFGASDVFDLNRNQVLAAYTCTECGRCTSMCPANITGKKLSPRKIMMDVRDRADEIGRNLDANRTEFINDEEKDSTSKLTPANYDDGKNLFSYITNEELRACTTCNACVEACPVLINPLDIILVLRRNLILEQSDSPEAWNAMFNAIEGNGAPWAFSSDDRDKWITDAV